MFVAKSLLDAQLGAHELRMKMMVGDVSTLRGLRLGLGSTMTVTQVLKQLIVTPTMAILKLQQGDGRLGNGVMLQHA